MNLRRLILGSLWAMPILGFLDIFIGNFDYMPQDPPVPVLVTASIWFCALALWPLFVYALIFQHDPTGISSLAVLLTTMLFWGFIVELLFITKARLWPNPVRGRKSRL